MTSMKYKYRYSKNTVNYNKYKERIFIFFIDKCKCRARYKLYFYYIEYVYEEKMSEHQIDLIVNRLVELDESLNNIKTTKKSIDEEIKSLEDELLTYSETHGINMDSLTKGRYNVKPTTGRKLKIKK